MAQLFGKKFHSTMVGSSEVMVQLGTFLDTYDDGLEHAPRGHVEVEDMLKPVVRIAQVLLYIVRAGGDRLEAVRKCKPLVRALRRRSRENTGTWDGMILSSGSWSGQSLSKLLGAVIEHMMMNESSCLLHHYFFVYILLNLSR